MKRLDIEPTMEVLIESLRNDSAGRNGDIIDFIKMLADTEGPYAYMIDEPWGDGKTFFVKSVELLLNAMNPQSVDYGYDHTELNSVLSRLGDTDFLALPYYFNAWDNDFSDDPLTTLFASMAAEFDRNDLLKASKVKVKDGIAAVIDAGLAVGQVPFRISGAAGALTSESLIASFKTKAEIRERISRLAEESIVEVANKLVIFVDELDRCRPDFAVRLLEQTKSLFCSESIIFVFSADSSQLAKAVGGMYGSGFDTSKFLERFFDERIKLCPVDSVKFTGDGVNYNGGNRFDKLARELLDSKVLTIRDAYRIKRNLESARHYCLEGPNHELPQMIASCTVLPLLIFIERDDIDLYRRITTGADFDAVYEYGRVFPSFMENVRDTIVRLRGNMHGSEDVSFSDEDCRAYMRDLCIAIFGSTEGHPEHYEARERLGGFCSPTFDSRVYEQLKFPEIF
ncbi:MAG: hypothetical protein IKG18_02950 [Atopobiaceae bacterium]|nr:hypothetical protein [Atopobiaceae bacterium]